MKPRWIVLMIVFAVAASVVALYALWAFWPSEAAKQGGGVAEHKTVHFFWISRGLSRESLFFVMVAIAGALGGMVHVVKSFSWYVGNRLLRWSWVAFYLLKPVLGAAMATVLYFIIRAGFFSPSASTSQTSPYGFAAVSALAGLFSDQAVEKLRRVASEIFEEAEQGKDSASTAPVAMAVTPEVTATSAVLRATINPRGHDTSYQFEWGETTDYGQTAPAAPASVGAGLVEQPVAQTITGLKSGTVYHCRVVVFSEAGGKSVSDDVPFTTLMG